MGAGSCSSQLSAHEQQLLVARNQQKSHCWGRKNVNCGAGIGADQSKSDPCAPLFQLPAGKCRWIHQLSSVVFVSVKGSTNSQRSTCILVASVIIPKHYVFFKTPYFQKWTLLLIFAARIYGHFSLGRSNIGF